MRALTWIRPTYASVVALIALALTVGGVAYAATSLPAKSVGTKQLTKNAVVGSKVKNGSLLATDVKGKLKGAEGNKGPAGNAGVQGAASTATQTVLSGTAALAGANEFFAASGVSTGDADEPDVMTLSPAKPMVAENLTVHLENPPGPGVTRRIDLRLNGLITTDLECTITHPATSCTSTGSAKDELLIPASSRISFGNVSAPGPASATQLRFAFTLRNAP